MINLIKGSRVISFDILRTIAAFAVVTLHVAARRFYTSFPFGEWEVLNVYDSLSRWGVPIFVMISGALFLDSKKYVTIKKLYGKNIVRILCAFLFWSVVYQFYATSEDTTLRQFVCGVIKGPAHLWFLKMLLGLYVIIPIIRLIVIDRKIEFYFLVLAFLTSFIIPLFLNIMRYYVPVLNVAATNLINTIGLNIASGYIGYFVLGHYLSTIDINYLKGMFYCMGALSFLIVIILTSKISHYLGSPTIVLYDNLTPFTLFEAIAIFVFVTVNSEVFPQRFYSKVLNISKMSFGVYLIHYMVIMVADEQFGINTSNYNAILFVPCFSLFVFVVSYIISWILSKIPIINRFVM